ncbi:unnamed protein product [Lymnaea stagnalis]|uniref:Uncharacterized protein n=1 Tax=Lymnaea stagnalis TaxID=6523 RepID=A0AAV2HXL3_LYMST
MAPTMQSDSGTSYRRSADHGVDHTLKTAPSDPINILVSLSDDDNSCETYFCSRDTCPSIRAFMPEPSDAFREALGKMRLETPKSDDSTKRGTSTETVRKLSPCSSPTPDKSSSTSRSTSPRTTPSTKTSAATQSLLSPRVEDMPKSPRSAGSRRPASFGGADLIKPKPARRSSHCEKRVSWADERGSDHQLISVRLIRPRLSADTHPTTSSAPGQSILRNTGT